MPTDISTIYREQKNKLQNAVTFLYDIELNISYRVSSQEMVLLSDASILIPGDYTTYFKEDGDIKSYSLGPYGRILFDSAILTADSTLITYQGQSCTKLFRNKNDIINYNSYKPFKVELFDIIYLTEYNQSITFNNGSGSHTYIPFPIKFDKKGSNNELVFSDVNIEVDAVSRTIIRYLHRFKGLIGRNVRLYHYFLDANITNVEDTIQEEMTILSTAYDENTIQLGTSPVKFQNTEIPGRKYLQDICQWIYKSKECGYPFDGELVFCDHRLMTIHGCFSHSLNQKTKNQVLRFGGFPGVNNR